jgi:hypothetical protein
MKKLVLIVVAAIGVAIIPTIFAHHHCDKKLDALSKTVLDLVSGAEEVNTDLTTFETTCCDRVGGGTRAPGCACSTTAITAAGTLPAAGAYCLANDITSGDIYAIDAIGLQVKINLNGHTVTGNVRTGPNSYVYGGTVSGSVIVDSFSHVEEATIGGLRGISTSSVWSTGVLANNVFFSGDEVEIFGFASITIDDSLFSGDVRLVGIKDIIIRHSQVQGNVSHPDYGLEKMLFYDTAIAGSCMLAQTEALTNLGFWNSSVLDVDVAMDLPSAGSPVIAAQGSTFRRFALINSGTATGMVGLIDECTCEQLALTKIANLRCQNTVVNAQTVGSAVDVEDCQQVTFDHVQAYSSSDGAFVVHGGKNVLLKQCSGVADSGSSVAFDIGDSDETLFNVNLFECVAKNSDQGFWFGSPGTTGTVIRCMADSCREGFAAAQESMKIVFTGNVSVANTDSDYSTLSGDAFTPSVDPLTAVSWRNMGSRSL